MIIDIHRAQRIMLVGSGGAGKSTLAYQLQDVLGLPVIHLDQHYWRPGWEPMEEGAWQARVRELVQQDRWIMDGNYGGSFPARVPAADVILFLDYPRRVCLTRVLKRIVTSYGRVRCDMAPGCPEQFDWNFLKWVYNFPKHSRALLTTALDENNAHDKTVVFTHPRELRRYLKTLM